MPTRNPSSLAEIRRLGGLEVLVIPGQPGGLTVAMLHGYGADAYDLLTLADLLPMPEGTTWLFPHAPLTVELGPHMTGKAWFPIDMAAIQAAMMAGRVRDMRRESPAELARSMRMVQAMLTEVDADMKRTILAGFSQGAMTATALALHDPTPPLGLAILSGTLLDEATWQRLASTRQLDFFASHGEQDPLLNVAAAQALVHLLQQAGWRGELQRFRGGHEIPHEVLRNLAGYLAFVSGKALQDQ